jgi:hypothetical protein
MFSSGTPNEFCVGRNVDVEFGFLIVGDSKGWTSCWDVKTGDWVIPGFELSVDPFRNRNQTNHAPIKTVPIENKTVNTFQKPAFTSCLWRRRFLLSKRIRAGP